jgi:hypothetical protein
MEKQRKEIKDLWKQQQNKLVSIEPERHWPVYPKLPAIYKPPVLFWVP